MRIWVATKQTTGKGQRGKEQVRGLQTGSRWKCEFIAVKKQFRGLRSLKCPIWCGMSRLEFFAPNVLKCSWNDNDRILWGTTTTTRSSCSMFSESWFLKSVSEGWIPRFLLRQSLDSFLQPFIQPIKPNYPTAVNTQSYWQLTWFSNFCNWSPCGNISSFTLAEVHFRQEMGGKPLNWNAL